MTPPLIQPSSATAAVRRRRRRRPPPIRWLSGGIHRASPSCCRGGNPQLAGGVRHRGSGAT